MLIKASRITNLTDARYFAAKEVAFLGFNLEEGTPDYLEPMYMKAIREWVEGPKVVGEFLHSPAEVVREAAAFFGLDAVEVSPRIALAPLNGLEVLLRVSANTDQTDRAVQDLFQAAAPFVEYYILDLTHADWRSRLALWQQLCANYTVLLHTTEPAATLPELIEALQPAGLSLSGGEEEKVGVKLFEDVDAVFDWLEDA
jgi:phosphoribosylanthranilate isomerase